MYIARSARASSGFGSARQFSAVQASYATNPIASAWPPLLTTKGAPPSPINAYARVGGGADGFGGITSFPANYTPQTTWVEGQSHKGYPVNIPLRLFSSPTEDCPIQEQMFVCGAMLKWENLATVPAAGIPSGLALTVWNGVPAGIVTNPLGGTAPEARFVGVVRRPTTGAFTLALVDGVNVTYLPLTHPAGDVRIPVMVEYVIRNARLGRAARLTVYVGGVQVFDAAFGTSGLFGSYDSAAYTGLIMTTFAEAFQRVWCGAQWYGAGPDNPATR
jgi:hypothetical protein